MALELLSCLNHKSCFLGIVLVSPVGFLDTFFSTSVLTFGTFPLGCLIRRVKGGMMVLRQLNKKGVRSQETEARIA